LLLEHGGRLVIPPVRVLFVQLLVIQKAHQGRRAVVPEFNALRLGLQAFFHLVQIDALLFLLDADRRRRTAELYYRNRLLLQMGRRIGNQILDRLFGVLLRCRLRPTAKGLQPLEITLQLRAMRWGNLGYGILVGVEGATQLVQALGISPGALQVHHLLQRFQRTFRISHLPVGLGQKLMGFHLLGIVLQEVLEYLRGVFVLCLQEIQLTEKQTGPNVPRTGFQE
jgi:hypothetical protein